MGALGTWDLADELQARPDSRRTTTIATVSRVDDDGSVWVRLPGADADTPVNGQTYVNVSPGQTVQATIEGGRCSITGNSSSPAVGGGYVRQVVAPVEQKADTATDDAKRAKEAADAAEVDAGRANAAANAAQEDADTANRSARQALLGLSTVEDVVNVLEWLTAHSKATTDTTAVAGKAYYQRDATTGAMTRYEVPDGGDPAALGLYELDDAVADYIAAHLTLTNYGLNIMLDSTSGYIHLGTVDGTYARGTYFIDGGDVVALFGASGARIGKADCSNVSIDESALEMANRSGMRYFTLREDPDVTKTVMTSVYGSTLPSNTVQGSTFYVTYRHGYNDEYVGRVYFTQGTSASKVVFADAPSDLVISYDAISGIVLASCSAQGYQKRVVCIEYLVEGSLVYAAFGSASHLASRGNYTFSSGEGLIADSDKQTAIGKYNDNQSTNAFEIGNGTSESNRSNAFAVAWDGAIETANPSGTLNNLGLGVVDGTITSVESGVTISNVSLYRIGRLVVLSAMTSRQQGTGGESAVFTLPVGFRPAAAWRGPVGHTGKGSTTATGNASVYAVINTNGVVAINSLAAINLVAATFVTP